MDREGVLRIELRNERPVELADFTTSMAAVAESFKDYATDQSRDPLPDNMRLYVKSLRPGSIVAELVALTEQAQFLLSISMSWVDLLPISMMSSNFSWVKIRKPLSRPYHQHRSRLD